MTIESKPATRRCLAVLTLGALGVVYGDIGTSPLYALRKCFAGSHPLLPTRDNVVGNLSLACGVFLVLEAAFFAANLLKVLKGGWFPLAMGLAIFLLMATWEKGRELVWNKLKHHR